MNYEGLMVGSIREAGGSAGLVINPVAWTYPTTGSFVRLVEGFPKT